MPIDDESPLTPGPNFGEWKPEIGSPHNIVTFAASTAKSYEVIYDDLSDPLHPQRKKFTKVKGFSLRGQNAKEQFSNCSIQHCAEMFVRNKSISLPIPQFSIVINKKLKVLSSKISQKIFSNDVYDKRVPLRNSKDLYASAPLGYSFVPDSWLI